MMFVAIKNIRVYSFLLLLMMIIILMMMPVLVSQALPAQSRLEENCGVFPVTSSSSNNRTGHSPKPLVIYAVISDFSDCDAKTPQPIDYISGNGR
jgi:hypothetical protein